MSTSIALGAAGALGESGGGMESLGGGGVVVVPVVMGTSAASTSMSVGGRKTVYRVLTGWLSWGRQPLLVGEEGRLGLRVLSGRCKIGRVGRSRGPVPGLVPRVWNRMMLPVALQGWGK